MSDAPQQPEAGLTRDGSTGRYVQRHATAEDAPTDAPAPTEASAAAANADTPTATPSADTPPATQSGDDTTPPTTPPPAEPGEERDGRKRWMLLLLLLLILLALLCAGFSYMTWWRKDEPRTAQPTPTAAVTATAGTTRPSPSPSLTSNPNTTPNTSPSPSPSAAVKMVNMPNVVGMPADDAKVILEGAGFTSVKFVADGNPNTELQMLISYTVANQSVAAGTQVPADTAIVITCRATSNGKG